MASPVDALAVTNPTVLVEVLSDSTERFSRKAGRWLYTDATEGESLALPGLGGTLSVDRLYRGIAFDGDDPRGRHECP